MDSTEFTQLIYAYPVLPEWLSDFSCPTTGRKLIFHKIGMSKKNNIDRIKRELEETLCMYNPDPHEFKLKRVKSGLDSENKLHRLLDDYAEQLGEDIIVTRTFKSKEVYWLTREEIDDLFDKIDGQEVSYFDEYKKTYKYEFIIDELKNGKIRNVKIDLGDYNKANEGIKKSIIDIFDTKRPINSYIQLEKNSPKWIGGKKTVSRNTRNNKTKYYSLRDFKYDLNNDYIKATYDLVTS